MHVSLGTWRGKYCSFTQIKTFFFLFNIFKFEFPEVIRPGKLGSFTNMNWMIMHLFRPIRLIWHVLIWYVLYQSNILTFPSFPPQRSLTFDPCPLTVSGYQTSTQRNYSELACDGELLSVRCPPRSTISVQSAFYGRRASIPLQCVLSNHSPSAHLVAAREDVYCTMQTALQVTPMKAQYPTWKCYILY